MSEPLKAGRELDALIETQLFGRCAHQMAYVSTEELQSRARREIMAEWQANYGKQPPDAFVTAAAARRGGPRTRTRSSSASSVPSRASKAWPMRSTT